MEIKDLHEITKQIEPLDIKYKEYAKNRWKSIAKPLKSLGEMEEVISRICAINEGVFPAVKPALTVMCGDHGVVSEGVTQTGQEVTAVVCENFEKHKTSAAIMAKSIDADVFVIDAGINNRCYENKELIPFRVADRKIAKGTKNIAKENAMTEEECFKAICCGIEAAESLKKKGYTIIAVGEMGIGNTTSASALSAWLLGISSKEATGFGAGLSKEGYEKKVKVVSKAVERLEGKNWGAFQGLCALGGLEIAAMTGVFLGAAIHKIPAVIDGFVSSAAALCAVKISPDVKDYIFSSHLSHEPCAERILKELGLKAFIDADMCLGEGTGALMLIPLIKMCGEVYLKMSTFEEINIERYKEFK